MRCTTNQMQASNITEEEKNYKGAKSTQSKDEWQKMQKHSSDMSKN